jgi:chromosome partitioning protein
MATRIISVLNQKGGVGKTTTCVNLGAALSRRGQEVLLVDMDPQANLTVHVGLERSTYSLLLGRHSLGDAVQRCATPGLSVVPSTLALANAEIQLASAVGRELILRDALDEWLGPQPSPKADFVLIDCPPSLGILTMNALCASTDVLLPIQAEFFALQGVAGILESLKAVQRLNRNLKLSIVVPCMVDKRRTLARDVIEEVRSYFADRVTRTVIRVNVKLAGRPRPAPLPRARRSPSPRCSRGRTRRSSSRGSAPPPASR